jgi:hypothetical protein
MSTIFTTRTTSRIEVVPDATIRVRAFKPGSVEENGYITVDLLEFHPDFDERAKFRGEALVKASPELLLPEHAHIYVMCGAGYLEEPYISVNEVFIHGEDLRELMEWCRQETNRKKQYTALIVHPCPLPFPVFERGMPVTVITDSDNNGRFLGQSGAITVSSGDGRSGVKFADGTEWHFDSLHLRELAPGQYKHDVASIRRKEKKNNG